MWLLYMYFCIALLVGIQVSIHYNIDRNYSGRESFALGVLWGVPWVLTGLWWFAMGVKDVLVRGAK